MSGEQLIFTCALGNASDWTRIVASMDLNASPEPEEDEVFPERHSEEYFAPEEKVQYSEHLDHRETGAQIRRRVLLCLNFVGPNSF